VWFFIVGRSRVINEIADKKLAEAWKMGATRDNRVGLPARDDGGKRKPDVNVLQRRRATRMGAG
jgi:hypothetical protein